MLLIQSVKTFFWKIHTKPFDLFQQPLLLKFIYLGKCEVSHNDLVDFLAAGKELMVQGFVEKERNIDTACKKKNSQIEQNPIKAEILNPYTDVDNVDTNNISSILELDESDENLLIKNSKAEDTHTNSDIIVTLHSEILGA